MTTYDSYGPVEVIQCGDERLTVTSFPPLPTQWGTAWWVRLDDVWIRLRERPSGEQMTPTLAEELCGLIAARRPKPPASKPEM